MSGDELPGDKMSASPIEHVNDSIVFPSSLEQSPQSSNVYEKRSDMWIIKIKETLLFSLHNNGSLLGQKLEPTNYFLIRSVFSISGGARTPPLVGHW